MQIYSCQRVSLSKTSVATRWLIHHILQQYQNMETDKMVDNKIHVIPCRVYDEATVAFVDHLLKTCQYKQAAVMAMQPINSVLKRRLVFSVVDFIAQRYWD